MDLSGTIQGAGGVRGLLSVSKHTGTVQNPVRTPFYPTYDGNGNISEYLNRNGAPVAHYEYDAFGNTVVNTDTVGQFTYRFSTKPLDAEIGLYYYGYRFYDPLTGRWPSRDPIAERGGLNLHGIGNNDTLNYVDFLGMNMMPLPKRLLGWQCTCKMAAGSNCIVSFPENPDDCIDFGVTLMEIVSRGQIKRTKNEALKSATNFFIDASFESCPEGCRLDIPPVQIFWVNNCECKQIFSGDIQLPSIPKPAREQ